MTQPHQVAILKPLAVGAIALPCTIVIHALAFAATVNFLRYERRRGRTGAGLRIDLAIVSQSDSCSSGEGHVDVLANEDSYRTLHASVVLVSFHDRRHAPDEAHGIISKSLSGTGEGLMDVNIVKGSLDLRAWD